MTAYMRKCSGNKCSARPYYEKTSLKSSRSEIKEVDISALSARLKISTKNAYSDPEESDEENKVKNYFYHNIVLYDGLKESYLVGAERKDLSYFTNQWKVPINCVCRVDGSQVTYNRKRFVEDNIFYLPLRRE